MRYCVFLVAIAALVTVGCQTNPVAAVPSPVAQLGPDCDAIAARLDRGDWMVNNGSNIWKVNVDQSLQNMPPKHVGYVIGKRYRQMRGGPEFQMYQVTSLNRNEQLGHIDSVGRAVRYEPRRNRGFAEKTVGSGTLEESVGAIFDTYERVTLEETSPRRLAFESMDTSGDGVLQPAETQRFGDRVSGADRNKDGFVDYEEFAAIESL